jgi:two-component system LytT family response regulator
VEAAVRALIIDEEPQSRAVLASVLADRRDIKQFDSACDAFEAMEKISATAYDVLLVDIDSHERSDIELLDKAKWCEAVPPPVILVTSEQEPNLNAFSQHAVDYVLKPFSRLRMDQALDAALCKDADMGLRIPLTRESQTQKHRCSSVSKIAIKANGRILFIDPAEIMSVEADRNYVLLRCETDQHVLRESISLIAEKLRPLGFIRIHRSVLINSEFVEEVEPMPTGEYELRLRGGSAYTVTRSYRSNLKLIAASWIGTGGFR